jgi:type VI secretion system secreted protein Hcp
VTDATESRQENPMKTTRVFAALLLAAALVVAPGAYAADAFLKLEGVDGESTDDKHKGEIELDTFQLNALHGEVQRASRSIGAGAGKITFNPFSITRKIDKASTKLHEACSTGKHFSSATISLRKAGGSQQEFYVVHLHDVFLTSYRTGGGGATATETFLVNAASASLEYPPHRPAGAAMTAPPSVVIAPTPTSAPKSGGTAATKPLAK